MIKGKSNCPKCRGVMERGLFRTGNLTRVQFVVPGVKTSWNPVMAFMQGLSDEQDDQVYDLKAMAGERCRECGYLELYAISDEEQFGVWSARDVREP